MVKDAEIFSALMQKRVAQIPPQHVILWKYQQRHLNKNRGLKYDPPFAMDFVSCSSHVGPWNKAIRQKIYRTHPLKSTCCNHFNRMPQGWCPNIPMPLNFRAFKKLNFLLRIWKKNPTFQAFQNNLVHRMNISPKRSISMVRISVRSTHATPKTTTSLLQKV